MTVTFKTLLVFGPPGSGKGTLGEALAKAGNHYHLSSGDIFRSLSRESPEGKLYYSYIDKGLLGPDEGAVQIWHNHIQNLIKDKKFNPDQQLLLSDGIPRTLHQAELCDQYMDVQKIILLDVPEEVLLARLQRRAGLEGRVDDAEKEILHKRFAVYQEQTAETLDHYDPSLLVHINGDQAPDRVLHDVLDQLADFF